MSEMRSPTKDSSVLLRTYLQDAQRQRSKVKQVATFSSSSEVVFVPRPPAPVVCPCRECQALAQPLTA